MRPPNNSAGLASIAVIWARPAEDFNLVYFMVSGVSAFAAS